MALMERPDQPDEPKKKKLNIPHRDLNTLDLTLEQQFEFRRMRDTADNMSDEQAAGMLVQAARLLMIKRNTMQEGSINLAAELSLEQLFQLATLDKQCSELKKVEYDNSEGLTQLSKLEAMSKLLDTMLDLMLTDNKIRSLAKLPVAC